MQTKLLTGPDLGHLVGIGVGDDPDHGVAACHRVIGSQDDRLSVRRYLDGTAGGALTGQLSLRPPVRQRCPDQPRADAVAALAGHPVGVYQCVGIGEPVLTRAGHHAQLQQVVGDRGHRRLLELG